MADHPNQELLRRGYAAYGAGDLDTVNALFADDIVWHVAGQSPIAGDYTGKEQVFGFFGKLQELSDGTSKIEVHDVLANDTHGVALVVESATRGGRSHEELRPTSTTSPTARSPSSGTRIPISRRRTSSGRSGSASTRFRRGSLPSQPPQKLITPAWSAPANSGPYTAVGKG